jgi:hypothetical protein
METKGDCTSGDFPLCSIDAAYSQNTSPELCQQDFGFVDLDVSHVWLKKLYWEEISNGAIFNLVLLHLHRR